MQNSKNALRTQWEQWSMWMWIPERKKKWRGVNEDDKLLDANYFDSIIGEKIKKLETISGGEKRSDLLPQVSFVADLAGISR